ncbi:MAG: glycosyltransferase family 39 protein [Myxococcaceae bacterium]|nr:glycosyltransferase family 39 protein [Myxococcaceae bacterium]MCI0669951.1 glycosyltransferase family 39 protein [Myxococcaceae bacterium]
MARSSTSAAPVLVPEHPEPLRPLPVPPAIPTAAEPDPVRLGWLLFAVALLPRLFIFPLAQNLYGDAVVRTELAQRLLSEPRVLTSFADGAYQFGPLQLYLTALPLALGIEPVDAGRWVSLLFGALTVLPLFALTRRLFGWRAGVVAVLGLSVWGMHLQMSTTAGSEALSLFLVTWALALFGKGWDEGRLAPLAAAAGALNLACATRYDTWLLLPLLSVLLVFQRGDRIAAFTRALFFGFLCLPFPLLWMQGNELAHGNPLYPVRFIEEFHRGWVSEGVGRYGELPYRLHNLFFWPGAALFTLTPLVGFFGMVGMWRTWRDEPHDRWLVLVALVPTAYYAFRGAVLLDFVPLARFAVSQLVLLLPFVAEGATALLSGRATWVRRGTVGLAGVLAVGMPLAIGLFTWRNDTGVSNSLKPVSPVATNPVPVMKVADYLHEQVRPGSGVVALDEDPVYMDVQIGFFSGLGEDRLLRHRWGTDFDKRLAVQVPDYVVLMKGGKLAARPDMVVRADGLTWRGVEYEPVAGMKPTHQLFRRR